MNLYVNDGSVDLLFIGWLEKSLMRLVGWLVIMIPWLNCLQWFRYFNLILFNRVSRISTNDMHILWIYNHSFGNVEFIESDSKGFDPRSTTLFYHWPLKRLFN